MGFKGGPPLGGDADGVVDGAADGVVDGAVDGAVDGTADGVVDGVADGDAVVGLRVGANVGIALKASDAVHSTLQAQGHFAKSSAISTSVCGIMKSKEEIDKTLAMSTKYEVECHDQTMVHKYMHVSNHAALSTSPSLGITYETHDCEHLTVQRACPHFLTKSIDVELADVKGIVGAAAIKAS